MLIYFSDVGSRLWGGMGKENHVGLQPCGDEKAMDSRVMILSIQLLERFVFVMVVTKKAF